MADLQDDERPLTRTMLQMIATLTSQYSPSGTAPVEPDVDRDPDDDPFRDVPPELRLSALAGHHVVAVEHLAAGRADQAVAVLQPVAAGCRTLLGPEHPDTLTVEGALAVALVNAGDISAGLQLLEAVSETRIALLGPAHPASLTAQDALATALRLAGESRAAIDLASWVATARSRQLGPLHPDTLATRLNLGLGLAAAGDLQSACSVLASALDDAERGRTLLVHAITLRAALADCHGMLGLVDLAVGGLQTALADCMAVFGRMHPQTRALHSDLAEMRLS